MARQGGRVIVVGAGHNGLIAACYLARAGRDVLVLEQADVPGGGSRTAERIPGYRFDLHAVAHNIINMTSIPQELDLAGAGLAYQEMDPFSVAIRADGRIVRFYRSIDATVASIAASSPRDAEAYASFMRVAVPIIQSVLPTIRGTSQVRTALGRLGELRRLVRQQDFLQLGRDLLGPYAALLERDLASDLVRGPVAAFAAHANVSPLVPGGAIFAYWQAAYHLFGQWHPRGGSQALIDALLRRLAALGGQVRCNATVARIVASGGRVGGVVLADGEQLPSAAVITAIDPQTALLQLLNPPLAGPVAADLGAAHRANVVQALVHVATDRLPPYPGAQPADYHGLQSYVDTLSELAQGFRQAEAQELPDPLPLYAFTTSALDATLAPPGHHTVYLACPAAPGRVRGGWEARRAEFTERCLALVEARAPGFRASIQGVRAFTPDEMERVGCWPLGHPMYLDLTLDQLGPLRPTRRLGHHRTPIRGLYISGAGTAPVGGIAGTPGKQAAQALLHDPR